MHKSRFNEEEIVGVLKEHEAGTPTGGVVPLASGEHGDPVPLEA